MEELRTRDLFEAGFAMTRGLVFKGLDVSGTNGRHHPTATFLFMGEAAVEVSGEYERGEAEANVRLLKDAIDFLRKRLFAAIDHGVRR